MRDIRGIMIEVKRRRWAKTRRACGVAALFAAVAGGSGCALTERSFEVGAKLGVYAVDERQESQRMVKRKPWICVLMPSRCAEPTTEESGS